MMDSLVRQFEDVSGRLQLVTLLKTQEIIGSNDNIAYAVADNIELTIVNEGENLITQGETGSDLYFIISGLFSVIIDGRTIASCRPGEHVGEMPLIDSTLRRSATVVAEELSLVGKLSHAKLAKIAVHHPEVYLAIARTLARRLSENL